MLCAVCLAVNFIDSPLFSEDEVGFITWETLNEPQAHLQPAEYFVCPHQVNIGALLTAADAGCHLCSLIRADLYQVQGHESKESQQGIVELRIYRKTNKQGKLLDPADVVVVIKTEVRDIKIVLDIAHFDSEFLQSGTSRAVVNESRR
jgi:hypothetical protein